MEQVEEKGRGKSEGKACVCVVCVVTGQRMGVGVS